MISVDDAVRSLETLLAPSVSLGIRCRAIEMLGRFGEIDSLERVMLLP